MRTYEPGSAFPKRLSAFQGSVIIVFSLCVGVMLASAFIIGFASPGSANAGASLPSGRQAPLLTNTPTSTSTPSCGPGTDYGVTRTTGTLVSGTADIGNHCDDCVT